MRSLRGRLTLGVLVILAIVLAAATAIASRQVDDSERAALDDRLVRTADLSRATAQAAVDQEVPSDDRRLEAVLKATGSSLRVVLGGEELMNLGSAPPSQPHLRAGLQTFTAGGEHYRAYVTKVRDSSLGALLRIEVISSLSGLEDRQSQLYRRLLLLALAGLVVVGVAVWLTASLVLRPLARLRRVTSSIAEDEDLSRRVPSEGATELRSLVATFNAMLARLGRSAADRERALAATRRFAADAGHELRTPLTSVQATLSSLERHPDLPAERRTAMAADALAEQRRLVDLLDGLQALARGDAAPMAETDVDLADLTDGVVAAAAARYPGVAVSVELPDDPVVVAGWEPGLRSLVENLVVNAARHGGQDGRAGHIRVALHPGAPGPVLEVDDDGPGVPAGERKRIFEPFVRVDGVEAPGSGLGLALVAQQARHHGAAVEVGDAPLGGARFTVRFGAVARA